MWVTGDVDRALPILSGPMELDGEPIAPARVRMGRRGEDVTRLSVVIHQGKNRQVRRMCAQAGLEVRAPQAGAGGPGLAGPGTGAGTVAAPDRGGAAPSAGRGGGGSRRTWIGFARLK